ncbi:hypothetical protein ACFFJI_11110 [Allobacillus sp. GCM10007491]|uniref:Uncharacterized protein n=2 Tax=Allobacillus TaxID=1400133 RepID=A0A941CVE9_9BACI|nr:MULTISPECIES: hypothetical protein [Allobacillus]MBR7554702.1 hypothetical protein [Allobacillus saliphilus]TSJ66716.1 hypothetical protein FPQ13_03215 [Allobacillus salarius]
MKFVKITFFSLLTFGMVLMIPTENSFAEAEKQSNAKEEVSPSSIPFEYNMSPVHVNRTGTSARVTKDLNWGDDRSNVFYVTYRDGYGSYHYNDTSFTSYSTQTIPTTYSLPSSRTEITWPDYFKARSSTGQGNISGSITLRRY